ncbi:MAG: hypothetical protein WAN48_11410 [Actinomycetes bacterium]
MSTIGDLFFAFHGDDKQLQVDASKSGDKAGTTLGSRMTTSLKKSWSGADIGKGLVQGLGLAGGLGAVSVFSSAISGVIGILGDATAAAIADQESVNRLAASLKANVPAWNGNTDAIEANILAKQRLGFDDETLRNSLTVLAGATHDVTKAQEIQNTAMDLARFKGIDLQTASEALIKVEGGVYRSLKQLGIKLKDNATSTEALAAVQAVASGQAEAYANTNAGKLATSQIKVDEAMEKFGAVTMPIVTAAVVAAADAVEGLMNAFNDVDQQFAGSGGLGKAIGDAVSLDVALARFVAGDKKAPLEWALNYVNSFRAVGTGAGKAADDVIAGSGKMKDDMLADSRPAAAAVGTINEAWLGLKMTARVASTTAAEDMATMVDKLVGEADRAISDAFDPVIEKYKLMGLTAAESAAERADSAKGAGAAEHAALAQARKDEAEQLLAMTRAGNTGSKAYRDGIRDLKQNIHDASGPTKIALQAVLTKILAVERAGATIPINFKLNVNGNYSGKHGVEIYGSGGYASAGVPIIWGDKGSELFVPETNGYVLNHNDAMAVASASVPRSGGTSGGNTYIVNAQGLVRARTSDEIGASLRRLADFGVLDPAAYGDS